MAKTFLQVTARPPFRDLKGVFTKAEKQLMKDAQGNLRNQGRRLHGLVLEEAPEDSGEFKSRIRWRTFIGKDQAGVAVSGPEPLWTFITEGTRAHPIPAKNVDALKFYWAKGPQGPGIYFFKQVNHPGTKKNRFHGRAFRRWLPGARRDLAKISRDYTRTLGEETRRLRA